MSNHLIDLDLIRSLSYTCNGYIRSIGMLTQYPFEISVICTHGDTVVYINATIDKSDMSKIMKLQQMKKGASTHCMIQCKIPYGYNASGIRYKFQGGLPQKIQCDLNHYIKSRLLSCLVEIVCI